MKPLPVILAAVVAGASSGALAHVALRPNSVEGAGEPRVAELQLAELVDQLQEQQADLTRELATLRSDAQKLTPQSDRIPLGEIEDIVARAIDRRLAPAEARPAQPADSALAASAAEFDKHDAFDKLMSGELSEMERENFWQEIREAGVLDEVIAMFEDRAERLADDPEVQVDLGEAYLQKIFEVGNGPLAGVWATKADGAFDAALELDDRHWEARFSKAAALSFWPPVFGKQAEAIHHFEILAENQEQLAAEPGHAQTYLLLGNLYQQNGRPEDALAAFRKGLERFPDDAGLIQQIAMTEN